LITISDILHSHHVDLNIGQIGQNMAVLHLATLLKSDLRVVDFTSFSEGVRTRTPCIAEDPDFSICIPHTRGNCVSSMVMSAGRSVFRDEEGIERTLYLFIIGVPTTMASDYLRIIGALARIFKNRHAERELRSVESAEEFVQILSHQEMVL